MKILRICLLAVVSGSLYNCGDTGKRIENADTVSEMATDDTAVFFRNDAVWENISLDAPLVSEPDLEGTDVTVRGNDSVTIYQASQDILFDVDKAQLKQGAEDKLQKISENIRKRTSGRGMIRVLGFTDSTASKDYNMELGRERAKAVEEWLGTKGGFDESRLKVVSKGQQDPVATNQTPEGRQQNRRVEIVVVREQR